MSFQGDIGFLPLGKEEFFWGDLINGFDGEAGMLDSAPCEEAESIFKSQL